MLAIQSHTFYFTEPGVQDHTFAFSSRIEDYGAALQGFDLNYGTKDDHEVQALGAEIIRVELRSEETELFVQVELTLHDDEGVFGGNKGQGQIDIVAFADVKS
ncbi:MAG: hypothetical protein K2W92_07750 [Alphaproteobacteria bacterium]|nr:hypothetical protein [Alphaproteobacteria bacterium]